LRAAGVVVSATRRLAPAGTGGHAGQLSDRRAAGQAV